jgi:hypothetical protein
MSAEPVIEQVINPSYQKVVKALWVVAGGLVTVAVTIFGAGVYWANLNAEISGYKQIINEELVAIRELQATITGLKSDINVQFAKLQDLKNAKAFKNVATGTGSGYSADVAPGRCLADEVIVGLQPMQGGFDITFQCAKIPLLKLE